MRQISCDWDGMIHFVQPDRSARITLDPMIDRLSSRTPKNYALPPRYDESARQGIPFLCAEADRELGAGLMSRVHKSVRVWGLSRWNVGRAASSSCRTRRSRGRSRAHERYALSSDSFFVRLGAVSSSRPASVSEAPRAAAASSPDERRAIPLRCACGGARRAAISGDTPACRHRRRALGATPRWLMRATRCIYDLRS